MGTSSAPSSSDPEQKIVMGYLSIDRYHSAQDVYPPPQGPYTYPVPLPQPHAPPVYPVEYHPQGYGPPTSFPTNQRGYDTSSFSHKQGGYATSSFNHQGKCQINAAQNPYSQSMNEYYYQQHYKPPVVHEASETTSFGRMMLILMIVLVASMCMMSLVMWFIFGIYTPEFEVVSLKVSNFSATNTTLTGIWDASFTIKNHNEELTINIDHIRSSVFYQEVMIGVSSMQHLDVKKKEQTQFNFSITAEPQLTADRTQSWVLPRLAEDRSNGVVIFSLRLSMNANFTSPRLVYWQESMRVFCENLQVTFSPTSEGTLSSSPETPCLIHLRGSLV